MQRHKRLPKLGFGIKCNPLSGQSVRPIVWPWGPFVTLKNPVHFSLATTPELIQSSEFFLQQIQHELPSAGDYRRSWLARGEHIGKPQHASISIRFNFLT